MKSKVGKVVWITGASSGIGEALVYAFAKEKARIILSARNINELKRVRDAAGLNDENSLILPLDLAENVKIKSAVNVVLDKFHNIDILINNGGVSQRANAMDTSLDIDRHIMEVNFFGTVALTKEVLLGMIKNKSGHIIVMSSIAGKFGFYLRSSYSASKHALHGFFESLRMEIFKSNVKVLIVCPGKISTNISINAMQGDGTLHDKMDESNAKGMSAEHCAEQIVKAMKANKEEIYIGGNEIRAVWLKRFFPNLFSKVIRKQRPD